MSEALPHIESIAYYLPEKRLTNKDLVAEFDSWGEEKILEKIGVRERRVARADEFVSDLAEQAALTLFRESNVDPEEIDFLILCTQSPDYMIPATACTLQHRLRLRRSCGAVDLNQGCSGFMYSLAIAKSLIHTGIARKVLLLMGDTYTKHVHPQDKSTRTIFGDGAAAVLVTGDGSRSGIGEFVLGTDGAGIVHLGMPAGGMRLPRSPETAVAVADKFGYMRSANNLFMNGPEVYKFTLRTVPRLVEEVLLKNHLHMDDVDYFVFHQASRFILTGLRTAIGIPEERFCIGMADIGNTVSASIPIALKLAQQEGKIRSGDRVMLVGFGVGYSWGGTVIQCQ